MQTFPTKNSKLQECCQHLALKAFLLDNEMISLAVQPRTFE